MIFQSCQNEQQVKLVSQIDLKNKFEIGIPENWHIEKDSTNGTSSLIAADTTQDIQKALVVDMTWNNWEIYLNEHFKRSLDSINELAGFKTKNQKFYSKGEFEIYEYEINGFDSMNNLGVNSRNFYLKKAGKKGSLNLNARVNNRELNKNDLLLIDKIIETIKRE